MLSKPKIGEVYTGKVKVIKDYGAFIEFLPNIDGLLHISEVMWGRVDDMRQIFEIGDEVEVKLIDIDDSRKRYGLSRKALIPKNQ